MNPIRIKMNPDLADIIPGYLESIKKDLIILEKSLKSGDFKTIAKISHQMKGTALSYGFPDLTKFGSQMEIASQAGDLPQLVVLLGKTKVYLEAIVLE